MGDKLDSNIVPDEKGGILMNRTLIWASSVLAAGLLAAGLSNGLGSRHTLAATATPATTTVTVYGTSVANLSPTQASVTIGVTDQQSTAKAALSVNNQKMTTVIKAVESLGIASKDIATSGLNIYPQYGNGNPGPLVGYQVQNQVTITVATSQVGTVLDQAVAAGANQVEGVNFTVAPLSNSYQATYQRALHNALSQAQTLAAALKQKVLGVVSISYGSNSGSSGQFFNAGASTPSGMPIMPGQQQQTLTLKVVYRLGP